MVLGGLPHTFRCTLGPGQVSRCFLIRNASIDGACGAVRRRRGAPVGNSTLPRRSCFLGWILSRRCHLVPPPVHSLPGCHCRHQCSSAALNPWENLPLRPHPSHFHHQFLSPVPPFYPPASQWIGWHSGRQAPFLTPNGTPETHTTAPRVGRVARSSSRIGRLNRRPSYPLPGRAIPSGQGATALTCTSCKESSISALKIRFAPPKSTPRFWE